MTTRHITPHKGGRTCTAPSARMTPDERERLDKVLAERNVKHTDWYIGHVNADYAEITGDDRMNRKGYTPYYTFADLHDNTDAVAAKVAPLCKTSTEDIEDWLSAASTSTRKTAAELAEEWDALNS